MARINYITKQAEEVDKLRPNSSRIEKVAFDGFANNDIRTKHNPPELSKSSGIGEVLKSFAKPFAPAARAIGNVGKTLGGK